MTSSTVDTAARIAELERQVRELQHQLAARDDALRELAGRLRSIEARGLAEARPGTSRQ